MKRFIIVALSVIILIVAAFSLKHYFHSRSNQQAVATIKVAKGSIIEKAQAIGYIKPLHSNNVKSSVSGIVALIYHHEGDFVKKGEQLVKIKPAPSPTEYAQYYEQFSTAVAAEKSAFQDLTRYRRALKSRYITHDYQYYIAAKKNYATAKAQRILAEQKLALLDKGKIKVANKTIANIVTSPISGYILSRKVDIGDPVISLSSAQSATNLFTMANMHDLMFEGSIDEIDAAKIHMRMPAVITIGALPKQKIYGELTKVALQSDQENKEVAEDLPFNISFKVQISNLHLPKRIVLRSGYSATADINIKSAKDVLILPERVLHFDKNKPYVLFPPKKKGDESIKRFVSIGLSDGLNVQIKSGLALGDEVMDQTTDSESDK